MPKIIAIAHQKGGVGKSTLALNLAYTFSARVKTAIIDLDPQGTIARLKNIVGEGGPEIFDGFAHLPDLLNMDHAVIFIDTPPYNSNRLNELFLLSDVVIIPTKAGIPDVMAIESTVAFLKSAMVGKPQIKAGIVINMVKPRSGLTASVKKQLAKYDLPLLCDVHDRVSYARSILAGGVTATGDLQAIDEINNLTNQVMKMIL